MKKFFSASLIWLASIASIFLVQFIGSIVILSLPLSASMTVQYGIMALVQVANVLIVITTRRKFKFVSPYMPKRLECMTIIKSVGLGVITFVGMYLISQYVFVFLEYIGAKASYLDISGWYIIPAVLTTVILAPIGEEAVYRCSLTYGFNFGKTYVAIILSAFAFAIMHMSPMQTFYQFALGVMLGILVVRTQNVIYPIIAHSTSNILVIILSFIPLPSVPLYNPFTIIIAVLALAIGVMLVLIIMKSIPKREEKISVEIVKESSYEKSLAIFMCVLGVVVCLVCWISTFF
jgi:membrane protease YdiL (CAAX protease family)